MAHSIARVAVNRATPSDDLDNARDRLVEYHEITLHYREMRLRYPPPDKSLTKFQQSTWRQLQAQTFLSPAFLALVHPGLYQQECTLCGAPRANFHHIMFLCPELQPPSEWQLTDVEGWETAVSSSNPADQIRLVDWALRVAEGHKLPDTLRAPEPPHK